MAKNSKRKNTSRVDELLVDPVQDAKTSFKIRNNPPNIDDLKLDDQFNGKSMKGGGKDPFRSVSHASGLFHRNEINLFNKRYRYGIINPYETLSNCKEYLFFTKPDLNIFPRDDDTGTPSKELHPYLQTQPFWLYEMNEKHYNVIKALQLSLNTKNPFNHLLENMVQTNLDSPSITAEMIDTPNNSFGVGYTYRGSSEASDDSFDFSLEFKDTKDLPIYHFFKAYEDYETLKHHGKLTPYIYYIKNKILYDQYSIYKFLIDLDDGETIIYYSKYFGVKSKTLPRDVFSNTTFDNGLSYSIDFNAAFFDDMKPWIIKDFNQISKSYYDSLPYLIEPWNNVLERVDNRPAQAAYIVSEYNSHYKHDVNKLKWRGSDKY